MCCLKSCRNYVVTKHDLIYHLEAYFKCYKDMYLVLVIVVLVIFNNIY